MSNRSGFSDAFTSFIPIGIETGVPDLTRVDSTATAVDV
jgi:hypothetical protein